MDLPSFLKRRRGLRMRTEEHTKVKMEGLEEDPAAAFLAREQDELAGIADDTLGFTTDSSVRE